MNYRSPVITLGLLAVAANLAACGGGGGGAETPTAASYTLGGTISGLSSTGLIIADGVQPTSQTFEPQSVPAAGATVSFVFGGASATVAAGTQYAAVVQQQPIGNRCAVTDGTGVASADVTDITVSCTAPTVSLLVDPTDYASVTSTPNSFGASSVAVDGSGNVYVADRLARALLKIAPTGSATPMALTDAVTGAAISEPGIQQIAVDKTGNLYVAAIPSGSTAVVIQVITPAGSVSTLAGSGMPGSADAVASAASFSDWVKGLAIDANGNIYVADYGTTTVPNNKIRKVTPTGVVTTLAGSGAQGAANGSGSTASFDLGGADGNVVAVDPSGNVYVVEWPNEDVRKITPDGVVSTFAGGDGRFGNADGPGATVASFANPVAIATDSVGNVYVLDGSASIRLILPNAAVSTLVPANHSIYGAGNNVISVGGSQLTSLASSADGTLYTAGADAVNSGFSADIHEITFK